MLNVYLYNKHFALQGLSHYLEHMLFMGSEKYPDENDNCFTVSHVDQVVADAQKRD